MARSKVIGLAAALFFAGCVGQGESANVATSAIPPAEPAAVDADTGAIKGLVVNEENLPLGGATVALLETEFMTVSDAAGAFTLNRVPPGEYTLSAVSLGYDTDARGVTVAAGEIVTVTVILSAIAIEQSFIQTDITSGRFEVAFRIIPQVGGYAFGGDTIHSFETDDRTDAIGGLLYEMTWENTQALAGGMRLRAEVIGEDNEADFTFCVIDSTPPARCDGGDNVTKILENGHDDCDAEGCEMQWRGFTSTRYSGLPVDFGIMIDQEYTVYTSIFYRSPVPDGYSGMPDG